MEFIIGKQKYVAAEVHTCGEELEMGKMYVQVYPKSEDENLVRYISEEFNANEADKQAKAKLPVSFSMEVAHYYRTEEFKLYEVLERFDSDGLSLEIIDVEQSDFV